MLDVSREARVESWRERRGDGGDCEGEGSELPVGLRRVSIGVGRGGV